MAFADIFGDSATARVLDHLAKFEHRDYSLTELANCCDMSYRTLQRVFPVLVQKELVRETRKIGKARMYSLNLDNTTVKELHRLLVKDKPLPAQDSSHSIAYI